jgi:ribose transport system ATP-binding protein
MQIQEERLSDAALGHSKITLELSGIGKSFADISVLRNVDLEINGGEIHTLMGENGAGKSTLVKIISGVSKPSTGAMTIDGIPVSFDTPRDAELQGIAIMHQELSLIPEMTVAENVMLGHEPLIGGLIVDRTRMREMAKDALLRFGFTIDIDTPVKQLRVGEQQLIEIARALLMDARLLIMDEPTSALSQTEADILMEVIRDLALNGVAVLYISHRMDEVFEISDRVTVLRDGDYLGTMLASDTTPTDVIELMVGRRIEVVRIDRQTEPSPEKMLEVDSLTVSAAGRKVLEDVSFTLHKGEILGIGGLLGAGRTELLETLFGARDGSYSGRVCLAGEEVELRSPEEAVERGIALITEDRKATGLILNHSIADNVILPLLPRTSRFGLRSEKRKKEQALAVIQQLNVTARGPDHAVGQLSGGNQQKIVLGKWLATSPRILLLDEPTRGIDIGAKDEIYSLIGTLADQGISIILASSEIPEFLAVCDRVMVLCEGRVTGMLVGDDMSYDGIKHLAMQFS